MKTEVKIEDVKKYLDEIANKKSHGKFIEIFNKKEKDWLKDSEYWRGRWDSYFDILLLILERDDNREHLRLDKEANLLKP